MKVLTRYLALGAIAIILGSCSIAIGALNHKKARVVASAIWHGRTSSTTRTVRSITTARTMSPYVAKSRAMPPRPASSRVSKSRFIAPPGSKDISASTDIDFITYTITNLDPNSGEPDIFDYLDPFYPYIDVFLTPGNNYRVTVDVTLLSSSPLVASGASVGISGYGDSANIAVPADGSDVWVDMSIHAQGIVIKNQIGTTTMSYVDPTTGATAAPTFSGLTTPTALPRDKFFYTSDSLLYYFNWTLNTVYGVTSVNTTPAFAAATGFNGPANAAGFQISAICADPAYAGWFYVIGVNAGAWELDVVNYDPAGGVSTAVWYPVGTITPDLQFGRVTPTVVVTGVTADIYGFAYVTFYNYLPAGSTPVSGVAEFDSYLGGPAIASYIPNTTAAWTSSDSIFTDAMYNGSNIYVLASPNTSVAQAANHSTGTADVYILDTYLNQLSTNPSPVAQAFPGPSLPALTGGGSLLLPNKFVGTVEGGVFFLSQTDPVVGGTEYLSKVSLDLSTVGSEP